MLVDPFRAALEDSGAPGCRVGNCHAGKANPQVIEITRDKRVVWAFRDFTHFGNATSNAQVLDVSGKSLR